MIGRSPWYKAPTSGGTVTDNSIANAMIAVNIDGVTGPIAIHANRVTRSGGQFVSDCGTKMWPAVNIAPSARQFVSTAPGTVAAGNVKTTGCLLDRTSSGPE